MKLPALYAKDQKGRTKIWQVSTSGNKIVVSYGLLDGKRSTKTTVIKKGKNLGKANATTPDEQADLEAESKWNKKKDREGYSEDPESWEQLFYPMLALDARKFRKRLEKLVESGTPLIYDWKYDGVRLLCEGEAALSKRRTTYPIVNRSLHEQRYIAKCRLEAIIGTEAILDGENYIHGRLLQDIQSATKKRNKDSDLLTYRLYDFYCPAHPNMGCFERKAWLTMLDLSDLDSVTFDMTFDFKAPDESTLDDYLQELMAIAEKMGFEGIMLRVDEPYQVDSRNAALWKCKRPDDEEFLIVDVLEDKPYTFDDDEPIRQGKFECQTVDGETFEVVPTGGVEYKHSILDRKDIGKLLKVQFFGKTKREVPLFPVGLCVRDVDDISRD